MASQYPGSTYWPSISQPGWLCQVSGGLPPARRVCSTGRAAEPPPPATVALMISTPGYCFLYTGNSASSAAASPPEVHQENTSSFFSPAACEERGDCTKANNDANAMMGEQKRIFRRMTFFS